MALTEIEYNELRQQLDRIEMIQEQIMSALGVSIKRPIVQPPVKESDGVSQRHALQEKARMIHRTQGMEAYKKFWQEQYRKTPAKRARG